MVDPPDAEPLVSVELEREGGQRAGIVRAGASVMLKPRLGAERAIELEDSVPRLAESGFGQMLVAGLLPPGAVTAECVDVLDRRHAARTGGDAWLIQLDRAQLAHVNPVCFRDAERRLVPPPLPNDWERRPVEDADAPCPGCGSTSWDEVVPADGSRGMRGREGAPLEPTPIVVCHACGFEHSVGGWAHMMRVGGEDGAEARRKLERIRAQMRERRRQTLARLSFPVYVDAGRRARLSGWSGGDDELDELTVADAEPDSPLDGSLTITTALSEQNPHRGEREIVRSAFENHVDRALPAAAWERSQAAVAVARCLARRQAERSSAEATLATQTIEVDGERLPFTLLRSRDQWVAAHTGQRLTITIAAARIDPDALQLVPARDPERELLEPERAG